MRSGKYEISRSIKSSCAGCVGGVGTERVCQAVAVSVKSLDHVCHQGRGEGAILNKLQDMVTIERERERDDIVCVCVCVPGFSIERGTRSGHVDTWEENSPSGY